MSRELLEEQLAAGDAIEVKFCATIRLFPEDVAEADHDIAQAIQNCIGSSGARVVAYEPAFDEERER